MTARPRHLPRLLLAAVLLSGGLACRVERFTAEQCRCLADQPQLPRSWGDELGLRRCAAGMGGQGEATYDELQCRTWLQSPWLERPPDDDVAGRVVPWNILIPKHSISPPTICPCDGHMGLGWPAAMAWEIGCAEEEEDLRPSPETDRAREAKRATQLAEGAALALAHTQTAALVAATKRVLGPGTCLRALEAVGVELRIIVYADGALNMAALRDWHTVPPVRRKGPGSPSVDVAAALRELADLQAAGVQGGVVLAPMDDVKWQEVWSLFWALDDQLRPNRSGRHMWPVPVDSEYAAGGSALLERVIDRDRDELGEMGMELPYQKDMVELVDAPALGWDRDPQESGPP